MENKKYKFSLRLKLVVFITVLSIVTYSTSLFFISVVHKFIGDMTGLGEGVFTVLTFLAGIFWSGVLAFFAAGFITGPLKRLEIMV